ncbi:hypothetical protein GGS21DRAFT_85465 [Xylaria nigripes]|nr:hypothetical protein GGS21DRAFT_85465 [Xylaria nigripes]
MREQGNTEVEKVRHVPAHEQGQSSMMFSWSPSNWTRRASSPIPRTSPERLALASDENTSAKTILYLAYGSNMAAKTFLGARGIRPISQINVSAPAFELTFDLPGLPYSEPCFANTRPRKIPKPPVPVPGLPPPPPPYSVAPDNGPTWSKGIYGVVYEVTPEDYATIIKTEGGGQGYHDVLTLCFVLPPPLHVPERPPFPDLPKPFLAHTLYAPALPDPTNDDGESGEKTHACRNGLPKKLPWLRRLILPPHRPDSEYAQASLRYLNLLRDGSREHDLPEDYQKYLAQLQPYTITTTRQQIGRALFYVLVLPLLLIVTVVSKWIADDRGLTPHWFRLLTNALSNIAWMVYDCCFKPVFGDGERTIAERSRDAGARWGDKGTMIGGESVGEKNRLLDDW